MCFCTYARCEVYKIVRVRGIFARVSHGIY